MFLAEFLKGVKQFQNLVPGLPKFVFQEKFDVHQHLVIPGSSRVDFLPDFPDAPCQEQLNLRMDVLHIVLKDEIPFPYFLENTVQSLGEGVKFLFPEQTD